MNKEQFIRAIRKSGLYLGVWRIETESLQKKSWILGCVKEKDTWYIYVTDGNSQPSIMYTFKNEGKAFDKFFWFIYKHGTWKESSNVKK